MGKKYYCDYCKTHIQRDSNIIRKHNEGIPHIRNRTAHYESCKDATEVLAENARKKPCRTLLTSNECTFGATCRYSHYGPEQISQLQKKAQKMYNQRTKRLSDIIKKIECAEEITRQFLEKRARKQASASIECTQFWTYTEEQQDLTDLPASLQEIDPTRIDSNNFAEWG